MYFEHISGYFVLLADLNWDYECLLLKLPYLDMPNSLYSLFFIVKLSFWSENFVYLY